MTPEAYNSFFDELEKISASSGRLLVPKTRTGRRSIKASTLLRKDKEGTLYKGASIGGIEARLQRLLERRGENPDGSLKHLDTLTGGLADSKSPSDFTASSLRRGAKVEREHTSSGPVATEIAMDHLTEDPNYYKKLQKIESEKRAEDLGTNSAGYKLQGKIDYKGLPIDVENRKGSVREGKNADGSSWRTKFKFPYGYIKGTKGADGEEIDAYVGNARESDKAFVVKQKKDNGKYDEDTVMLGFNSAPEAKKAILDHYDDPKYIGEVLSTTVKALKKKLASDWNTGGDFRLGVSQPAEGGKKGRRSDQFPTLEGVKEGSSSSGLGSANQPYHFHSNKPPRAKKGDVPSMEGNDPGPARVEKREEGQDFVTTIPAGGAVFSSDTGPTRV